MADSSVVIWGYCLGLETMTRIKGSSPYFTAVVLINFSHHHWAVALYADGVFQEGRVPTCTVEEDLCFRVVVVDIMVVVSMKVVDISGGMAVVRAEPATLGTSPTNLTLPFILMLGLPSAAMLSTLRPL